MHLDLQQELTDSRFAEVGHPYRLFREQHGRYVAICSEFRYFAGPGRIAYEGQRLRHRVSLYSAGTFQRIATLDVRFPINDLVFHPAETWIAVATGSYDGGYMFEGELLLWDWGAETSRSLLLETREVVRCRWDSCERLVILLRPRHEEECENAFETYFCATLHDLRSPTELFPAGTGWEDPRLAGLEPVDPAQSGFDVPSGYTVPDLSAADLAELTAHGFEERHLVWEILWLDDETCILVHERCHAELWHMAKGRLLRFSGAGHGVELLSEPDGGCLVHVIQPANYKTNEHRSTLLRLDETTLTVLREFNHGCSFSIDSAGNILARDIGQLIDCGRVPTDQVLDREGSVLIEGDLGRFDALNHSLRLQGGQVLYFLRGASPASSVFYRTKTLVAISGGTHILELFPWDQVTGDGAETKIHRTAGVAAFVSDDEIILACEVSRPNAPRTGHLERLSLTDGKVAWQTLLTGSFTAIAVMHGFGSAAFAQPDGTIGLVELSSGRILWQSSLAIDGVPTIATALAAREDRLLVGTIDGRLLIGSLSC